MEIYAPSYCKHFKCIADKCRHSCCIDWEIDIDLKAYEKYKSLKSNFGKEIINNIVIDEDGAPHFALDKNERCKNLDERGLCRIISNLGEEYLCDICRLHPRFFNEIGGRVEMGLGLSCEEAVRIVLEDNRPYVFEKIGENQERASSFDDYDPFEDRNEALAFMEKQNVAFFEKLKAIEEKYGVSTDFYSYDEWIDTLLSFEILDGEWENILQNAKGKDKTSDSTQYQAELEALFKYFVFRHASKATLKSAFSSVIGFASLGVKLVSYLAEREENLTKPRLYEIVRLYSSEIEYSEDNTESLLFELEAELI